MGQFTLGSVPQKGPSAGRWWSTKWVPGVTRTVEATDTHGHGLGSGNGGVGDDVDNGARRPAPSQAAQAGYEYGLPLVEAPRTWAAFVRHTSMVMSQWVLTERLSWPRRRFTRLPTSPGGLVYGRPAASSTATPTPGTCW